MKRNNYQNLFFLTLAVVSLFLFGFTSAIASPNSPSNSIVNSSNEDISGNAVIGFAYEGLHLAYTFNFTKIKNVPSPSAKIYFTEQGWKSMKSTFKKTIDIDAVRNHKYVVSIGVANTPVILNKSALHNSQTWVIQLPVLINYENANDTITKKIILSLDITGTANSVNQRDFIINKVILNKS